MATAEVDSSTNEVGSGPIHRTDGNTPPVNVEDLRASCSGMATYRPIRFNIGLVMTV
jgi:hypothetical protein